ncbi:MAG: hypothetical protein WBF40_03345 [Methyloceanibacter sp.]
MTADEALAVGGKSSLAVKEAKDFLQALLSGGPVPSKQVDADAQEVGIAKATLRRAKKKLGIKPYKDGMKGAWLCALPKTLSPTEDAHLKNVSTFGTDEHLRAPTASIEVPGNGEKDMGQGQHDG